MSVFKLSNKNERFTVFPIQHQNLWNFYKKHVSTFWTVEEVYLVDDLSDWNNKLNDNERYFIKNVLAFFASSDGIINENIVSKFYDEIELPESRQFYSFQIAMEAVHSEMYSLLIDSYIQDQTEKKHLFNAIDTVPAVKRKANWALKWISSDKPLIQRILAFVCVEGIFFSGSFCAIYWLKNKGLMPGLATANEFISRDENLHAEYAIELYNMVSKEERLDESVVHELFKEAVEIEKQFIIESLPVSLLGMNSTLMTAYIQFVADRWISMLGYSKLFNSENPFGFMEMISLSTKENFFESRVSSYQRAGVGQSEVDRTISFDEDEDF
jgi:ribonucleotide reductase beta subunit family protein with ferritin-like domain